MRGEKLSNSKMTMRNLWVWLATAFLISHFSFLISCTSIDCPVQNTVFTVYNLMKADGKPDTMGVDTLWVWTKHSKGRDTLLNRLCGTSATSFYLPVSYTQPEDVLCFFYADTLGNHKLDTVRIRKEDYPHFESVDCQASFFHTITGVSTTHQFIDSVVIKNPQVNYDASKAHFYLYLKARH